MSVSLSTSAMYSRKENDQSVTPSFDQQRAQSNGQDSPVLLSMAGEEPCHRMEDEGRKEILLRFDQAMLTVPANEKKEYTEAMQRCPHVVAAESHPMQFLEYCEYNLWAATERMCNYWRERYDLFQERAFLPMSIDGNGAMDYQDILVLQAGFPALLPKTKNGRHVGFMDRGTWLSSTNRLNRLRACFCAVTKMAQIEGIQRPLEKGGGVLLFVNLIQPRLQPLDFALAKRQAHMLKNACPVRFDPHYLCILPRTMRGEVDGQNKRDYIADSISFFYDISGANYKSNVHFEIMPGDIRNTMLQMGCELDGIPTCYGGSWSFVKAQQWCKEEALKDSIAFAGVESGDKVSNILASPLPEQREICDEPTLKQKPTTDIHGAGAQATTCVKPKTTKGPRSGGTGRWTAERKRTINALHSRKKRQKKKQELEAMKKEKQELEVLNAHLHSENARLHELLREAQKYLPHT